MNAAREMAKLMLELIASDPEALAELADALSPHLHEAAPEPDRWMDTKGAAAYLGFPSANALHKLTAARMVPFEQDAPGGKCWFQKSQLDAWRRGEFPYAFQTASKRPRTRSARKHERPALAGLSFVIGAPGFEPD
jgi:hypothetical protein